MHLRLLTLALLASALPLPAQTIISKTLDFGSSTNSDTGRYTSQAIVNGKPAIAYFNVTEGSLMFARNCAADGSGTWTITTLDSDGYVGEYCSLAVVNGHPAISYFDNNRALKYVRALDQSGTNWSTPATLDTGQVGRHTSLAVVGGKPAVSYQDLTNLDLKFVRALDGSGTNWGTPVTLDSTGDVGQYTSLREVNGHPAISYYDATNGDLKFVRALDASGTNWDTPLTPDSINNKGQFTSLAVVSGHPAISYYDVIPGSLKYVRALDASGTSWGTPVTLDNAGLGSIGNCTSLAVVAENPAISYYDYITGDLKYVRALDVYGTNWSMPLTLDSTGSVGHHNSLAVVDGNPAISYYDFTNRDLKSIRSSDPSGTIWPAATIPDTGVQSGDVGQYTSQAVVNGYPAISYQDKTNLDLKFVRALDASGMIWGTPLTLDSTGSVGSYTSLAVVNGHPAISYYDATNGNLKYIRALDTSGSSWGTPLTLDSTGEVGRSTSLVVVNGHPAISYYSGGQADLKYVRALDASGASWGAPLTLVSTGKAGFYNSLAVVNGYPAISYDEGINEDLRYVRALDASGTSWGTPVTLDSLGDVGSFNSLVVVNGHPAISYNDNTNDDLRYVRALDASGTNWGTPMTLDSTGSVGYYSSLAVVNGNPAISYFDGGNQDLKYVRALDASGMGWGTPVTLDSNRSVGYFLSLAVIVGNPAISYYDNTNFNLKWATLNSPPSPEITVEQPVGAATDFANGGSKAFGNVTRSSNADLVFSIKNYGNAALNLSDTPNKVAVSGSGDFTVIVQPASPVDGPSGSTSFTVRFSPTSLGLKTATLSIVNNDPDEGTFTVNLTGTGINDNPTFSGYAFNTLQNTLATMTAAELLTRAADADGGTLQVQGVAPNGLSSQSGTVALVDQTITYTPPAGFSGLDTFTVLIGDGQGGSVTGIVTAYVTDGIPSEPNASVVTLQPSGDVALLFFGITGETYVVERSADLNSWTPLYTLSATSSGMLSYLDPTPPPGKAFYRAVPFEE